MSVNPKFIREVVIDRCLCSERGCNVQEILKEVNIVMRRMGLEEISSRTTINYDLDAIQMRHHIALETIRRGKYLFYRYQDPNFSIYKGELQTQEVICLQATMGILYGFQGLPDFEWVNSVIEKCKIVLTEESMYARYVGLEHNPYAHGLENLAPICHAISRQQVLKIWYHSFRYPEPQENTVHPYYLKQYNQRWFLICYNEYRKELSTYPLDRIEKIEECKDIAFIKNTICDFEEYFEDMIGVSRENDSVTQKVLLWVCKQQVPYIETKPLHGSQKVKERREDGTVFELDVVLNYELEQQILLQGEKMEVLAPASLREKIANRLNAALERYK